VYTTYIACYKIGRTSR